MSGIRQGVHLDEPAVADERPGRRVERVQQRGSTVGVLTIRNAP
ncbi:MAG: hypothetical protein ABI609_17985 [Acidobacteriota bacterium]